MSDNSFDLLLIEDSPEDAELVIRALQKTGMDLKIVQKEDGAEAIDFIFDEGTNRDGKGVKVPKLILLDLNMPKISGLEVLKRVRADERTKRTPVVVFTSSKEDADVKTCYDNGVNSYIVKPVEFNEFAKTITSLSHYWFRLNLPSE